MLDTKFLDHDVGELSSILLKHLLLPASKTFTLPKSNVLKDLYPSGIS